MPLLAHLAELAGLQTMQNQTRWRTHGPSRDQSNTASQTPTPHPNPLCFATLGMGGRGSCGSTQLTRLLICRGGKKRHKLKKKNLFTCVNFDLRGAAADLVGEASPTLPPPTLVSPSVDLPFPRFSSSSFLPKRQSEKKKKKKKGGERSGLSGVPGSARFRQRTNVSQGKCGPLLKNVCRKP